jgi:Holliday junction resolvasome RuvABC DNA-binding subunit
MIADRLREAAELLVHQNANPFRVRAYRRAAQTVERLPEDIAETYRDGGLEALTALPGIGAAIADHVAEMLRTGRWVQLERMRGTFDPETVFCNVPGIGPKLAHEIHEALHVDTLAALEMAAHDGRLAGVPGIGPRRAAMIRAALADMLNRPLPRRRIEDGGEVEEPDVSMLLDVDGEYRAKAEAGSLPTIAPKRFNPTGQAWLPILHTSRGVWQFTLLFSNTAQAHKFNRTRDWVVVYFHHDEAPEGSRTIVTETGGALAARRVVRGREVECRRYYEGRNEAPAA